jgi:ribosome assembly protein 1
MAPSKAGSSPRGTVTSSTAHDSIKFKLRAVPIPSALLEFILDNLSILRRLRRERDLDEDATGSAEDVDDDREIDTQGDVERTPTVKPDQYWRTLQQRCSEAGGEWADVADRIWAFGPQSAGGCLLIDARPTSSPQSSVIDCLLCGQLLIASIGYASV